MYNQRAKMKIEEADQLLKTAQNEMFRSEEDVVPFMACSKARESIVNYLTGFLLQNGVELDEVLSMESLINKCKGINSKFSELELDTILCKQENHNSKYCSDLVKVKECVAVAKKTKDFLAETSDNVEIWPISKHVK
jgi:hypothetical protein